jgi:hypothetical protein
MIPPTVETLIPQDEHDDDLLTRTEASAYLRRFQVRLKPASLARIWSVGGEGPPCQHIRGKPWYPRGALRGWALGQRSGLRQKRGDAEPSTRVQD